MYLTSIFPLTTSRKKREDPLTQDDVRLVDGFKGQLGQLMSNLPEDWEAVKGYQGV